MYDLSKGHLCTENEKYIFFYYNVKNVLFFMTGLNYFVAGKNFTSSYISMATITSAVIDCNYCNHIQHREWASFPILCHIH